MAVPLQPIAPSTAAEDLIATLNDRLRKIQGAFAALTTGVTPLGTPTPRSSGGGGNAIVPLVPVLPVAGSANAVDGALVDYKQMLYRWNAGLSIAQLMTQPVGPQLYQDTHANRLKNYVAANYPLSSTFWETDNQVLLLNEAVAGVNTWVPVGAYPISDLRGNQSFYYGAYWPEGMPYNQTDTNLIYISAPQLIGPCLISGLAGANTGVTVTYTGIGGAFSTNWAQYKIIVNIGVNSFPVQVASVQSITALTLASPLQTGECTLTIIGGQWNFQSGVWSDTLAKRPAPTYPQDLGLTYAVVDDTHSSPEGWVSVANGFVVGQVNVAAWVYVSGTAHGTLAEMLGMAGGGPVVLSTYEVGVRFWELDYGHVHQWTGSGWAFADGETSQQRVLGDQSPQGPPTTIGGSCVNGWYPCDGGTYNCVNGDGTIRAVPTPNFNGNANQPAICGGGFTGVENAAVPDTVDYTSISSLGSVPAVSGFPSATSSVDIPATGTLTALTPGGHTHTVSEDAIAQTVVSAFNRGALLLDGTFIPDNFTDSMWLRA